MPLKHKDTRTLLFTTTAYLAVVYPIWIVWEMEALPALLLALLLPILTLQFALFRRTRQHQDEQLRQIQALLSLHKQIPLRAPLPPLTGWAASPALAQTLHALVRDVQPRHVVELGSGASTLVVAYGLEANGFGHITSLDQDAHYGAATTEQLRLHGLTARARVVHAPLRPWTLDGQTWSWYDLTDLPDEKIDLLIVDGPHGELQRLARYPALPALIDRLAPDAVIVLDDANRPDEQRILDRWCERYEELALSYAPSPKGTAILRRRAVAAPTS